jgi:hypothetical protein
MLFVDCHRNSPANHYKLTQPTKHEEHQATKQRLLSVA